MAIYVTDENFEKEVLKAEEPVLVDFYADWCGPCKMMAPVIDEISEEITSAKIVKINVDKAEEVSQKYKILTIPTFMFFKNGEAVDTVIGAVPKEMLADKLSRM